METLAEILETAAPDRLALVDEIGSATDPEEGSALAVAFLEEYLARGGRAIITTHLSAVKGFAGGREDAVCAAMEFDEKTGRPNYRLHPGLTGRSHALSVAEQQGLPPNVITRARELLGSAWERRDRAESEAEAALERLRHAETGLAREQENARREAERLTLEREAVSRERQQMLETGLAEQTVDSLPSPEARLACAGLRPRRPALADARSLGRPLAAETTQLTGETSRPDTETNQPATEASHAVDKGKPSG